MTPHAFDHYAADYDRHFTHSAIGRAQRRQVWRALQPLLTEKLDILEVNCGTGEDALRLAKLGHRVTATDISSAMIAEANRNLNRNLNLNLNLNLTFQQSSFLTLDQHFTPGQFDLIFSNFGGLNCLSPEDTRRLAAIFQKLLKPDGRLFLVYMSRHCWWEKAYYTFKGKPEKARRRQLPGPLSIPLGGQSVEVWYYSPAELEQIYTPAFNFVGRHPIGLFVPPSYLEFWFSRRKPLLRAMEKLDHLLAFPFLTGRADHFALVFRRQKPV